jgi:hypothetical protein
MSIRAGALARSAGDASSANYGMAPTVTSFVRQFGSEAPQS